MNGSGLKILQYNSKTIYDMELIFSIDRWLKSENSLNQDQTDVFKLQTSLIEIAEVWRHSTHTHIYIYIYETID